MFGRVCTLERVTANKIKALLLESESDSLDFKECQYIIQGDRPSPDAVRHGRQSFLKDILAFSNADRHGVAYILVGVHANKGSVAEVVGIKDSTDDCYFQNLFHGKTNHPVKFRYEELMVGERRVGVFTIFPPSRRPICLRQEVADIPAGQIFIRRGTTTEIAMPDEFHREAVPSIPLSARDRDLENLAKRWLFIFRAHRACKGDIPLLLPDCHIVPSRLTHWHSIIDLLNENVRRASCDLFNINRDWLETGDGPIQRTIAVDSQMDEAIREMLRIRKSDRDAALVCLSDHMAGAHASASGGLYLSTVVRTIGSRSFTAYLPFMNVLPWRDPMHHTEYLLLTVFTAMELDLAVWGRVNPLSLIKKIARGEVLSVKLLNTSRPRGGWHPEDAIFYGKKAGVDLERYHDRERFIRGLIDAKSELGITASRWATLLHRPVSLPRDGTNRAPPAPDTFRR